MAGIIGYLLAYSINSRLNGFEGREAWRWIFLLEGIPTALIGALALFYLPDYPQTARFLKPPEREACMIRLRDVVGQRDTNDGEHPHFDSKELVATLSDFKIYLFAIGNFFKGFNLYSFTHA